MAVNLSEVQEILKDSLYSGPSLLDGLVKPKGKKKMDGNFKMVFEHTTPGGGVGEEHVVRIEADEDDMEPIKIIQTHGSTKKCIKLSKKEAKMFWRVFCNLNSTYDFFDNF